MSETRSEEGDLRDGNRMETKRTRPGGLKSFIAILGPPMVQLGELHVDISGAQGQPEA